MSKYPVERYDAQRTYLLHIANELAEANRLKRLELKGMNVNWNGNILNDTDLEDQA